MVSITLMKSYLARKSFLSGFQSRHIVVCKEENVAQGRRSAHQGHWVGRSDLSDEHIVLTFGGREFSRTIRRLELSRRHDARFLDR